MQRYTMDVDDKFEATIKHLAYENNISIGELLRNAIASYKYLKSETKDPSRKVSISDKDDHIIKDIILP